LQIGQPAQFGAVVAGDVQATETPAQVSPHEIMIKDSILPVEYWAHPF
jgi:hypothetical protein